MDYLPKVSIGLVLYKGEEYLKPAIQSLVNQDYPNIEYLFRDQSPKGEAYEYIKRELFGEFRRIKLERGANLWHSGGHNSLMRRMTGEYYIVSSCDMLYPRDFVSKIIRVMEQPENERYGSATGKLMVWDFKSASPSDSETEQKTNIIDSCGIGITPSHHFYDIGQGEEDKGQYDQMKDIFGPSGALSVFRKTALDDIAYRNETGKTEYYDSLLHYKNDVDLAYRLQWAGHQSLLVPEVKIWHDRQARNLHTSPTLTGRILKARDDKSRFIKENSFFGQQVVMKKNFSPGFSFGVRLKTFTYRFMSVGYASLCEPFLLKQFTALKEFKKEIADKHKNIKFRVAPSQIEKLMK